MTLSLNDYDFPLDENQIAKFPSNVRDESRLLVVNRTENAFEEHRHFYEIEAYLKEGDILVYNETKVSKRRVYLLSESGRPHEAVFLESRDPAGKEWICILKNRRKLKLGDTLTPDGFVDFLFKYKGKEGDLSLLEASKTILESDFETWGNIPIPPYLKRKANKEDEERYQTIFAQSLGSVAAPTAGLHFTEALKIKLERKGIDFLPVNLRIGYGTFEPLTEDQILQKKLHSEKYFMSPDTAEKLTQARSEGRRVIAIGTTSLRLLESVFDPDSQTYKAGAGETDIFLSPGCPINSVQGLITNFHLPRSSLLLLVSTFGGRELVMRAYSHALGKNFRFYSYGDVMFLI